MTVAAAKTPTGTVVVRADGKVIGKAKIDAADRGKVVVRLAPLRKGKHKLVARYSGSATVAASASTQRTVRLR